MVWAFFLLPMFGWNAVSTWCSLCSWFTVFPMSLFSSDMPVPFARSCLYKVCTICKVWLLNTMGRLLFAVFFIDVRVTRVCCAIWLKLEFASAPRLRHRSPQRHIKYRSLKGPILIRLLRCVVHMVLNFFGMPSFMSSFCVTLFIWCSFLIWCAIFLLLLCSLSYSKIAKRKRIFCIFMFIKWDRSDGPGVYSLSYCIILVLINVYIWNTCRYNKSFTY